MNAQGKGDVRASVQTAEQIGGWVWVITLVDFDAREVRRSLVSEETYTTQRAAKDAGDARLQALAHDQ
ncbi:hypothetical protein [Paraburkholderia sp.]|uniref:hypothetical protein n=1 Tax=Paraburkholderia sp. TaxID=1926495 RepID=UPI0025F69AC1|nr:hypothetical protein [Paraburkholderia sp.]